jgi:hypothetical protein
VVQEVFKELLVLKAQQGLEPKAPKDQLAVGSLLNSYLMQLPPLSYIQQMNFQSALQINTLQLEKSPTSIPRG